MTKADYIQTLDGVGVLGGISNDVDRKPQERDLARVMQIATLLLLKKDFNSAKNILKISIEELEK